MSEEKAKTGSSGELFPILQPEAAKGMARLAAEAVPTGEGHEIRFYALEARSILNRAVSRRRLHFTWSINPYRGCEFACRYCYARYTHEFLEKRDPAAFEREIYVKQEAAWLLRRDLRKVKPGEEIAMGTATDPYQPVERRLGVTRGLLEVLAEQEGLEIGIVTKSALIARDVDVLQAVARRNRLVICVTITTPDAGLARILEPRAPRPDIRLETVRRLRRAGLTVGVLNSPLLPGITDNGPAMHRMAALAKAADASFFSAQPLFLKPCSRATYLEFVEEHFPALQEEYERRFAEAEFASAAYTRRMREMVRVVTERHGLSARLSDSLLTRDGGQFLADTREPAQAQLWPVEEVAFERPGGGRGSMERRRQAVASALGLAYSSSKAS
jgi:DNA repair photolyase